MGDYIERIVESQKKDQSCCEKTPHEHAHVGDANGGNILVSTYVTYCPECLTIHDSRINLSK